MKGAKGDSNFDLKKYAYGNNSIAGSSISNIISM